MKGDLKAIYENGVFRPLEPVDCPEHQRVTLRLIKGDEQATQEGALWENQRRELKVLLGKLASVVTSNPADGLTNRDHDRILYGEKG
jgi:predicted DNA-binding antitoxin AbrB/MazE fold protein